METDQTIPDAETDQTEISSNHLSSFILGGTCAASLMRLNHNSEPYAHGAVSFLLVKTLLNALENNCTHPPGAVIQLNETGSKLAKFVPWTMLNTELYRRSGLFEGWNEAYFGFLLAASVPTALATVELKENVFNRVVTLVNGLNVVGLGYLAIKQHNYWVLGMSVLCTLDCFQSRYLSKIVHTSQSNIRNVFRSFFAGMLPFLLDSQ